MTSTWWWAWVGGVGLVLALALGYDWRYRGWGSPFPLHVRRHRGAVLADEPTDVGPHRSWAWAGDALWAVVLLAMALAVVGFAR